VLVLEPGSGGTWARAAKPPATAASIMHRELKAAMTAARVRGIRGRGIRP